MRYSVYRKSDGADSLGKHGRTRKGSWVESDSDRPVRPAVNSQVSQVLHCTAVCMRAPIAMRVFRGTIASTDEPAMAHQPMEGRKKKPAGIRGGAVI